MALKVCETEVLAKFDRLVKKDELHYSPPKRLHVTEDNKFQVRSRPFLGAVSDTPLTTPPPSSKSPSPPP